MVLAECLNGGKPPPPSRRRAKKSSWLTIDMLFFAVVMCLLCSLTSVGARSPHPPPLRRIHPISRSTIQIRPRVNPHALNPRSYVQPPHHSTLSHSDTFLLTIPLPNLLTHPAQILLRPTDHLFHPDAKITYANGKSEKLRAEDWRVYTGQVIRPNWVERVWQSDIRGFGGREVDERAVLGSARIMVHHPGDDESSPTFEGVFSINNENYNILTEDRYDRVKTDQDVEFVNVDGARLAIYRDRDVHHLPSGPHTDIHSCKHDELSYNSNTSHPVWQNSLSSMDSLYVGLDYLEKRDDTGGMTGSSNFVNSINVTTGCPKTQQIVYMGVALDCNYVTTYGNSDNARTQVLNNWNQISALYKQTFNISLGIIELVVQNATCPSSAVAGTEWNVACSNTVTLDQRLSTFSQWRGNKGADGTGLWHLMSACPTSSEVGVAWLGTLCQSDSSLQSGSYVSGTAISTATKTEWSLIAHEIGHGFGAIHDCTSGCSLSGGCCPLSSSTCSAGGRFIMNPTTAASEVSFSGCTLGNICSNIGSKSVSSSCIQTPGAQTVISLSQCGNGIVEAGEQCDPGLNATSACCDPSTCRFRTGAVCDPTNSLCCTSSCQLASAGTVCRPAVNSICDVPETCTGTNSTCPRDVTVSDGTDCGDGLACAAGTCTSLDLQCQSAGASNNLTTACGQKDDRSCVVTCKSPRNANQCVVLQTPLVDGSPCGYGGHCYNSTCAAGSTDALISAWYRQNLNIAIPVTVIAGLAVLIILYLISRCIWRCCARDRARQRTAGTVVPPNIRQSAFAAGTRPPPPPTRQRNTNSLTSIDPITRTSLVSREPSPSSFQGAPPPPGGGYGQYLTPQNGAGVGAGYGQTQGGWHGHPQGQNYQQYQQYQQHQQGRHGPVHGNGNGNGWVDDTRYNGPNYGDQQYGGGYR